MQDAIWLKILSYLVIFVIANQDIGLMSMVYARTFVEMVSHWRQIAMIITLSQVMGAVQLVSLRQVSVLITQQLHLVLEVRFYCGIKLKISSSIKLKTQQT